MKKMSIGFIVVIVIIFILIGCGNKKFDYIVLIVELVLNINKDIEGKIV